MSSALPTGWTTGVDAKGRTYFINHLKKETTYDDPRGSSIASPTTPPSQQTPIYGNIPAYQTTTPPVAQNPYKIQNPYTIGLNNISTTIQNTISNTIASASSHPLTPQPSPHSFHHMPLPPGYEAKLDPTGRVYFVNHNTKTTSFVDPRPEYYTRPPPSYQTPSYTAPPLQPQSPAPYPHVQSNASMYYPPSYGSSSSYDPLSTSSAPPMPYEPVSHGSSDPAYLSPTSYLRHSGSSDPNFLHASPHFSSSDPNLLHSSPHFSSSDPNLLHPSHSSDSIQRAQPTSPPAPIRTRLDDIVVQKAIGKGAFGQVFLAEWKGVPVAMKAVNSEGLQEFENELHLLMDLAFPYVVRCFGLWVDETQKPYMVLEMMSRGDLLSLLQEHLELTLDQLTKMSKQVAEGMNYLHSRDVIHRDLACRNLLVSSDLVVKISDFGLSRQASLYYESHSTKIPYRWTAPEAIAYHKFGKKSDVWSFGVVIYEIFSRGRVPYHMWSNEQVVKNVLEGARLEIPESTPPFLNSIAKDCFKEQAKDRPSFQDIVNIYKQNKKSAENTQVPKSNSAIHEYRTDLPPSVPTSVYEKTPTNSNQTNYNNSNQPNYNNSNSNQPNYNNSNQPNYNNSNYNNSNQTNYNNSNSNQTNYNNSNQPNYNNSNPNQPNYNNSNSNQTNYNNSNPNQPNIQPTSPTSQSGPSAQLKKTGWKPALKPEHPTKNSFLH